MAQRHSFFLPGDTPHYAPDRTYRADHLRIELRLDFERKRIEGAVTYVLQPAAIFSHPPDADAAEVLLDAAEMEILEVKPARSWSHAEGKVRVLPAAKAGETVTLTVRYAAEPRQGLYFLEPDDAYPNRPRQAWTQSEPEDGKYWFPCFDFPNQKMTTEMLATIPADLVAVSNGALVAVEDIAGGRRWHFRQDVPHPAYLITLAAGDFAQIEETWDGIPVQYFVQKGCEEDGRRAFGDTPRMLDFFSRATGVRYPYAKYAQVAVADFIIGGMENTSATTQTERTLHDQRAHLDFTSNPLVSHELAHQWFGDLVTCREWAHAWLNEGFATYLESTWREHDRGADEFSYDLFELRENYLREDRGRYRRAIVTNVYSDPSDLFDRHLYDKAGLVLHMLRRQLGDEAWWACLRHYLERHRGGNVITLDFQRAIEDVTGRNLDWFFQQWIYSPGHPELKVSYSWDAEARLASVLVKQTQKTAGSNGQAPAPTPNGTTTPLFRLPVDLSFMVEGTEHRFPIVVDSAERTFAFRFDAPPERVRFDPGMRALKSAEFDLPVKLLAGQLVSDEDALLRIDAARALGKKGTREAVAALGQSLQKDGFWGVQAQVARVLADVKTAEAKALLLRALETPHPKARRAVVEALGAFRDEDAAEALRTKVTKGDASYFVEAETFRALGCTRQSGVYDVLLSGLERPSHDEVIRAAVFDGLKELRDDRAIDVALEWMHYGRPARAREAAVRSLEKLGERQTRIDDELIHLLDDQRLASRGTRIAAVSVLRKRKCRDALPAFRKLIDRDPDGRLVRLVREAVQALESGEDRDDELRQLRERMDALAEENRKLRDRIDRLEAR